VRIVGPILGILAGITVLGGIVWYSRYAPWVPQPPNPRLARVGLSEPVSIRMKREAEARAKEQQKHASAPAEREPGRPALATKAPFPKAVVGETVHDFGTQEILQEGKHHFRIENKGEGPLSLATPISTGLPWKREVAPGQSTEYEMTWRSFEPSANFAKTATIWTSDPKLPEVQLKVQGRILAPVRVEPKGDWSVKTMKGDKDAKFTGVIGSETESSFQIVSIDRSSTQVKVETRPLTAEELRHEGMKSGYALDVTVDKNIPDGVFQADLKVTTTIKGNETVGVRVMALQLR
jgi:hypothetical protein